MRTLITGGAGFLGAHLVRECLHRGDAVTVLDDLSGGFRENVPEEAELVVGSILDHVLVDELFEERSFDLVYHLAAYAAEGLSHFIRRFNYSNNLIGSANLVNASIRNEVRRFVFTSSIAVYGEGVLPLREDQRPSPEDPYGIAKLAVEQDLAAAAEMFGLEYVIFRPHNVYGEFQNLGDRYRNVVGIFMNQVMQDAPLTVFGTGEQTRAFSYVGDIVPALAASALIPEARNQVFNAGGDEVYTVNQLADTVLEVAGSNTPKRHLEARNEVQHAYSDHSKFRSVFGDPTATSLPDGIRRMWAWAQERGVTKTPKFNDIEVVENLPAVWLED